MQDYEGEVQEFRYTRKEVFAPLLAILAILFIMGLLSSTFFSPRFFNKLTRTDYTLIYVLVFISIVGIVYFLYMWLRRKNFVLITDNEGITNSNFAKKEKINWNTIKSYTYQCGHHYWFLFLYLDKKRRINFYGELKDFEELIRTIGEKTQLIFKEFQYTMRRKLNSLLFIILFFFNIGIIYICGKYLLIGRMFWNDAIGITALILFSTLVAMFNQFRWGQTKLSITDIGLAMKPWMGKKVFISWSEISDTTKIELVYVQLTLVTKVWELIIKSKNKTIIIYEDIDNVDELVNIIENKTGLSLGL